MRGVKIAVVVLVVLGAAVRLALAPVVATLTRRELDRMRGMRGTFSGAEVSVTRLSYALDELRIDKVSGTGERTAYVSARRLEVGLRWRELLRGRLLGALRVDHPRVVIHSGGDSSERGERTPSNAPDEVARTLRQLVRFRVDRAEVRAAEIVWVFDEGPHPPELTLRQLDGTLENFATDAGPAQAGPSVLAASGTLQRTGEVSVFASADPRSRRLTFAGSARLRRLALADLAPLLAAKTGLEPTRGVLDMDAVFKCLDGHLTGSVRPRLRDADVRQGQPGIDNAIKTALADLSIRILSERAGGRNTVTTTVPLEGDITRPDAELWPSIFGVVRNAFVGGLGESLTRHPRPQEGRDPGGRSARRGGCAPAATRSAESAGAK